MKTRIKLAGAALALTLAAPLFAQAAPPAAPASPMAGEPHVMKRVIIRNGHGMGGMHMGGGMMSKLSPEGRDILRQAMAEGPIAVNRAAIDAARKKMLDILAADRLDVAALRSAMSEERAITARQQETHQESMLAAFQKLSAADRKAFADSMRGMHMQMEMRMKGMGQRMKMMHMRHGGPGGDDMPPPPPPPGGDI